MRRARNKKTCKIKFVSFADDISKERGLRTSEHMNTSNIKIVILTALVLLQCRW